MATLQERIHDKAEAQSAARKRLTNMATRESDRPSPSEVGEAIDKLVFATADLIKLNTAQDLARDAG